MGTVLLGESVAELTTGGYGAGSYWTAIYPEVSAGLGVLSVVQNSSGSYDYLHGVATGMKESLSSKFKGYHSRDVMAGVLPEAEDCQEAKEYCYGVRETYHPPEGSGLGVNEEGTYFEDAA